MRCLLLLLASTLASTSSGPQTPSNTPPDTAFYAVSYVEVVPASRSAAIAALKQYRDASRRLDAGFGRLEFFEQLGRPGHFAIIEAWSHQQTFDARDATAQKQLQDALKAIRVSGYDLRPYKALTVDATPPATSSRAVVVVTHVDVTPNPVVPEMLKRLADAGRREDGNIRFDVLQHTMRANHFTVIEIWRDQKALDAHVAAAPTRQYRDELQPMTGSPLDERVYKVGE
jgi:quinol monooxygenase YgiN